jgi:hypothetical protein
MRNRASLFCQTARISICTCKAKDRQGLLKQISWQMYVAVRPDSALKAPLQPVQ